MPVHSVGSYSERTFCPRCRERVRIEDVRISALFICPGCGSVLCVSPAYRILTLFFCLATSLLLSYAIGLRAYAAIAWIPLFSVALIVVPNFAKFIFAPRLQVHTETDLIARKEEPWRRNLRLFLTCWIGLTFFILAYGFVLGWVAFLLGGSQRDIREMTDMWSVPLGWLNSVFVVTPNRSFLAVFGIVFANSFFYAAVLTATIRLVQRRLRQRITQIGISGTSQNDEGVDDL